MKHCYEKSNRKTKYQQGWKGKNKAKGKWQPKRTRPQNVEEKENVAHYKKFKVVRQGHGSQPGGQHNGGDGIGWLQCWTCGKEHLRKDCPQN